MSPSETTSREDRIKISSDILSSADALNDKPRLTGSIMMMGYYNYLPERAELKKSVIELIPYDNGEDDYPNLQRPVLQGISI